MLGYEKLIGSSNSHNKRTGIWGIGNLGEVNSAPLDVETWIGHFLTDQSFFSKDQSWTRVTDQPCRNPSKNDPPLPKLAPIKQWRSQARTISEDTMTIVTQITISRLDTLAVQCKHWKGAIAAAVYIPYAIGSGVVSSELSNINFTSIESIVDRLDDFHRATEKEAVRGETCALDLELVVETFDSILDPAISKYPTNAVRNRALLLSRSEILVLLDGDMIPGRKSLFNQIHNSQPDAPASDLLKELRRGKVFVVGRPFLF